MTSEISSSRPDSPNGEPQRNGRPPLAQKTNAEARTSGGIPEESRHAFIVAMTVAVLASSLGDVSLKKGISSVPQPHAQELGRVLDVAVHAMTNIWFDLGVVLMLVHFYGFVRALRLGPLSLVVPLRSTTYILTTLLAQYFLREVVTPVRWAGILVVLIGVTLVGRSGGGEG
jgi:drug/metabolite transporter (DMT)-like permease